MNDVPEMVMKVARAIDDALRHDPYLPDVARAAINALREPSHEMMIAGDKALEVETDNPPSWEALRAMIDAALASPTKD